MPVLMEEPYKRLDDAQGLNGEQDIILGSAQGMPTKNSKPTLKMYKGLVCLAVVEICLAILMFLLGITCTAIDGNGGRNRYWASSCTFGTGIWVGIACIIAASDRFLALRVPYGRRGFMIAYMVLCIIAAVADGILITFSSEWIARNNFAYKYYGQSTFLVSIILNVLLLLEAVSHMVLSITSSAFLCCNFNCCCRKREIVVVYTANAANNPNFETVNFLPPGVVVGKNAQIIYV